MSLGYTNFTLVRHLLANSLMRKTEDTIDELGDVINIGNSLDTNLVSDALIATYAQDAQQTIDNALNGIYATPFYRVADLELTLLEDVGEYSDGSSIVVSGNAGVLSAGDSMIIYNGIIKEEFIVESVSGDLNGYTIVPSSSIINMFYATSGTRVVRADYPAAIKYIATRLTVANMFDKLFTAQADKQESQFGKFYRNLANNQLNNVLAGSTILHGVHRISNLTCSPTLIKPMFPQMGGKGEPYKMQDPGRGG